MRRLLVGALAAGFACGCRPAATPAPPPVAVAAAAPAPWASLDALVGHYPSQSDLFETSVIAPTLKALLGDKFTAFKANMATEAPLQRDGGVLYASGNKAHEGGVNQAYLIIDPASQRLEVGLWENRKLQTFASPGPPLPKPKDIATLIQNTSSAPSGE